MLLNAVVLNFPNACNSKFMVLNAANTVRPQHSPLSALPASPMYSRSFNTPSVV